MNEENDNVEWFEEKCQLGPVFLVNAKGFTPEGAVAAMNEYGGWSSFHLNTKLGKMAGRIVELAADGYLMKQIARELGIDKTGLKRFCDKLGIDVTPRPTLDEIEDEILEAVSEGMTAGKLAEEFGFTVNAIRKWLERKNIVLPDAYHCGFVIAKGKYICIPVKNHPAADGMGYVRLHRLIMEQMIGRFLTKDEVVHHKDDNTFNNHPDNLEIMSLPEHTGHHSRKGDTGWTLHHKRNKI